MKLRYIILSLFIVMIAACYEVNEEITIDKNGKGTYVTKMDMGQLFAMMKTMAGEELQNVGLGQSMDTLISMKSILDSTKDITPEQRRLLNDGTVKFKMDISKDIFNADVKFPFNSFNDLQQLMSGAASGGLGDIMSKVMASKDSSRAISPTDQQGLDQLNNVFNVTVNNKLISKQLNKARYDSLMNRPEMAQMKSMMGAGFEILYTTTIRLPRPVKKSDNSLIKLSEDKKTVTIKYDLLKLLETPEKFSYSIEY